MKESPDPQSRIQELISLSGILGVGFLDISLLDQALTHTSYANEIKACNVMHNERLEFLGDAVLDLIVSDYLYRRFVDFPEGELTKARAYIVCEQTLARRAAEIGIGQYLRLGKGEAVTGGRDRISILADAFEAIIGAIYLDRGLDQATNFVIKCLEAEFASVAHGNYGRDFKTLLQEVIQRNSNQRIHYEIVGERGPDHNKTFIVALYINAELFGYGEGKSKKEAEQHAARQGLIKLGALN